MLSNTRAQQTGSPIDSIIIAVALSIVNGLILLDMGYGWAWVISGMVLAAVGWIVVPNVLYWLVKGVISRLRDDTRGQAPNHQWDVIGIACICGIFAYGYGVSLIGAFFVFLGSLYIYYRESIIEFVNAHLNPLSDQ